MARHHSFRRCSAMAVLALVVVLASCGDSDDQSAEERYCEAGDRVEADVQALTEVDPIEGGTSAVEEAVGDLQSSATELADSAQEVAAEETDALESALGDLQSAIESLGSDGITEENVSAITNAVAAVTDAGIAVKSTLTETCE